MSASIVLSNLSFATPDGRRLFNDLNLSFGAERAGLVGRNGVGKTTLLKLVAGDLRPGAGSIAASGSIGVLRQALQPDADETIADLFGVRQALALLRRAERGQASIEELAGADWDVEARIGLALGRLGLEADAETRLAALSGGQRTRAALGALIFAEPDFILLDEPTNNLDRDGREAVVDLLASWRGGAVVVSHDRELLDTMDSIIELTTLGATRYGGNWSRYHALKALELEAAQANLAGAEARLADVDRRAQTTAERKARKDSAGRRKGARGDIPRIALGKRRDAAEATSGENARLAERRRADALDAVSVARERVEVLQPFSVDLPPTGLPAGRTVLEMDRVEAGYASGQPVIRNFSLTITGPERIALTGPNGSGKTTLLALVAGGLKPWAGNLRVAVPFALLDQSVSILDPTASIRANFLRLNPGANENACRAALARFMFRADAALQVVSTLSGGQMLRAGLACVLGGPEPVPFLILDEPTNHLDTDSIERWRPGSGPMTEPCWSSAMTSHFSRRSA